MNDENRESHQRRPYRLPLNKSNKKQENGFTDEDNREVQDRSRRVSNSRGYREVKNGELDKEDKDNIQQRPFRKPKRRFIKTRLPVDFSVKVRLKELLHFISTVRIWHIFDSTGPSNMPDYPCIF